MKINKLLLATIAGVLLVSCSDDDSTSKQAGAYNNGVFILNQGNFTKGNASVSFLSESLALENDIYKTVNGASSILGDVGQDIGLNGDYAYLVMNNSQKIEVVNRYTFVHVATINSGLSNPRYIAFANGKGYVTNWGDGNNPSDDYVAVVDLASNKVTSSIPVAEGPEKIIEEGGKLYVSHYGGYNYGKTVSVINSASNSLTGTIAVGDAPKSMEIENGKLYVLCEGNPSWYAAGESFGELDVINLSDNTIVSKKEFAGKHPSNLVIENDKLYYTVDADVYRMNPDDALPSAPLFTLSSQQGAYGIYCFAVKGSQIYVGDALNYNAQGKVYLYSTEGQLQNTFTVGIIPAGFYFND